MRDKRGETFSDGPAGRFNSLLTGARPISQTVISTTPTAYAMVHQIDVFWKQAIFKYVFYSNPNVMVPESRELPDNLVFMPLEGTITGST